MTDLIKHFNENIRDTLWNSKGSEGFKTKGDSYKKYFKIQLTMVWSVKDETFTEHDNQFNNRLALGYYGIGKQKGIDSRLVSEAAMIKGVKTTSDHLIGATEIGKFIQSECEKHNWDIDYMVNTWLYEHLWLWMTIKVTKEEHSRDNIKRNEHSIEDKMSLKHYINVSNLVYRPYKKK